MEKGDKMGYNEIREYLGKIKNKTDCKDCNLKNVKDRPMVIVPPPKDIKVMLISRDPPYDWMVAYNWAIENIQDKGIPRLSLFHAIPLHLSMRFGEVTDINTGINVFNILLKYCYWTHLHKCPTMNTNEFDPSNAEKCSKQYLGEEISHIKENIEMIIGLGGHVAGFLLKDKNIKIKELLGKEQKGCWENIPVQIVYHTSPRNEHLWKPENKKLKATVCKIIEELRKL